MKHLFTLLCLLMLCCFPVGKGLLAQEKTIKIRLEKTLPEAHEFTFVWEGGDYKTTYYEVKEILDQEPMVQQQIFLYKIHRISAIVKNPWTLEDLRALFVSKGFVVIDKSDPNPVNDNAPHH